MAAAKFETLSAEELVAYLEEHYPSLSKDVLGRIIDQSIDGEVFLALDDQSVKELAPLLGDRVRLKKAIKTCPSRVSTVEDTLRAKCVVPRPHTEDESLACDISSCESDGELKTCRKQCPIVLSTDSEEETEAPKLKKQHLAKSSSISDGQDCSPSTSMESNVIKVESMDRSKGVTVKVERAESDWAVKLSIPTRFSSETMSSIQSGVLTKRARDEIVQSLSTLMLVHSDRPEPEDYTTVCKKLIQKYPTLKDKVDNGYSSWRGKLLMKFKNLRRPARADKMGLVIQPPLPRSKKRTESLAQPSASDIEEYERHVEFMKKKYESKKWSLTSMLTLLEKTSEQRQLWLKDKPRVKMVLETFPCLSDSRIMLKEFCRQVHVDEQTWRKIEKQIFEYAPLDEKKAVKDLLVQYSQTEVANADRDTVYAVLLLSAILVRKKFKANFLTVFEGEAIDVEEELKTLEVHSPRVIVFGVTKDSPSDIKVVIEQENVLPMSSVVDALHYCFASYYVFDAVFPPEFHLVLLFLEKYVYGLKPSQKLPLSVTILYDSLQKTSV